MKKVTKAVIPAAGLGTRVLITALIIMPTINKNKNNFIKNDKTSFITNNINLFR